MKKLQTHIAERVYDVLTKFAEASPKHYDRESFIYHFAVLSETSEDFRLTCMDDSPRTFKCSSIEDMRLDGKGRDRVNAIFTTIRDSQNTSLNEFTVKKNEV